MNFRTLPLVIGLLLSLYLPAFAGLAADPSERPVTPISNQGKKWRIGYLEGGQHGSFPQDLRAIVEALMQMGWIEAKEIPAQGNREDAGPLWHWLAAELKSDYLQFVDDAFYSANWENSLRSGNQQQLMARLREKKDLDLILAYGTWAGQDLAVDEHSTNSIIMEVTDAVEAGIIKNPSNSGRSYIYADIDPDRHLDQLRLFHDIIGFKTLGVAYEDSPAGRSICSLKKIHEAARERGFTLVPCFANFSNLSQEQAEQNIASCYDHLAKKVDAVYVSYHPGVSLHNISNIVRPLLKNKVPSFAQGTSEEVRRGILFSISMDDYRLVGRHQAQIIAKVLNGAKPGELQQVFKNPLKLTINLKTATIIGYNPSINILSTADEIYQSIDNN